MQVWSTEFAQIRENRGFSKPIPRFAHIWRTNTWVSGCRFGWCTRPCCAICGIWSQSAVRSYLQQLPKPLLILSREGKRQFQERCEPYLLTDFETLVPNQIWVS